MCQHDPQYTIENESAGGYGCPKCNAAKAAAAVDVIEKHAARWSTDEQRAAWQAEAQAHGRELTDEQIDRMISRRNRLTGRSDNRLNIPALNEIDAQLQTVPAGYRRDVDLLLGRKSAARWSTDEERAAWQAEAQAHGRELAEQTMDAWHAHLAGMSPEEIALNERMHDHDVEPHEFHGVPLADVLAEDMPEQYDSATEGHW